MSSTDLAVVEHGKYVALASDLDRMKKVLARTIGNDTLSPRDLPHIGIPPGGSTSWIIPGPSGDETTRTLEGILLYHRQTRALWPTDAEIKAGEPRRPKCVSEDADTGVGKPGGVCDHCPMNQWDTGKNGRGKACAQKEVWFLLRAGSFLPNVLALPSMSLDNAKHYRINLALASIDPLSVVTTLTLSAQDGPEGKFGIAIPEATARLSEQDYERAEVLLDDLLPMMQAAAAEVGTQADAHGQAFEVPNFETEDAA